MRICEQCGVANGDDAEFCGGCGEFLEWDDKKDGKKAPEPVVTTAEPVATKVEPVATKVEPVARNAEPVVHPVPDRGRVYQRETARDREPAEVVQPEVRAETVANTGGPAPVQPGERVPQRVRREPVVVEEPPVGPGQIACRSCGVGNDPDRRFCRRCGTPLAAAGATRLPWWRRLLNWLFKRRTRAAGYRPRGRGQRAIRVWPVFVFILAAIIAVAALPSLRRPVANGIGVVRDRLSGVEQVDPVNPAASSGTGAAKNAFDGANNVYWAPDPPAPQAAGQWLAFDLPKPMRLQYLVITTGVSTKREEFLAEARPQTVELALTSADGKTQTKAVRLSDSTGGQKVQVVADDITKVKMTITSIYGAQPGRLVAIAEVEVFVRK